MLLNSVLSPQNKCHFYKKKEKKKQILFFFSFLSSCEALRLLKSSHSTLSDGTIANIFCIRLFTESIWWLGNYSNPFRPFQFVVAYTSQQKYSLNILHVLCVIFTPKFRLNVWRGRFTPRTFHLFRKTLNFILPIHTHTHGWIIFPCLTQQETPDLTARCFF